MTNIREYLETKRISFSELEENFRLKTTLEALYESLDHCRNCGDKHNLVSYHSEPWTSVIYCGKCDAITLKIHADKMSGNHKDTYKIFVGGP